MASSLDPRRQAYAQSPPLPTINTSTTTTTSTSSNNNNNNQDLTTNNLLKPIDIPYPLIKSIISHAHLHTSIAIEQHRSDQLSSISQQCPLPPPPPIIPSNGSTTIPTPHPSETATRDAIASSLQSSLTKLHTYKSQLTDTSTIFHSELTNLITSKIKPISTPLTISLQSQLQIHLQTLDSLAKTIKSYAEAVSLARSDQEVAVAKTVAVSKDLQTNWNPENVNTLLHRLSESLNNLDNALVSEADALRGIWKRKQKMTDGMDTVFEAMGPPVSLKRKRSRLEAINMSLNAWKREVDDFEKRKKKRKSGDEGDTDKDKDKDMKNELNTLVTKQSGWNELLKDVETLRDTIKTVLTTTNNSTRELEKHLKWIKENVQKAEESLSTTKTNLSMEKKIAIMDGMLLDAQELVSLISSTSTTNSSSSAEESDIETCLNMLVRPVVIEAVTGCVKDVGIMGFLEMDFGKRERELLDGQEKRFEALMEKVRRR